ncbi:MAG: thioredoxin domain-containing protein [Firmicutes bacterium]|nr:thioredoxin domain-containing protein [Bacillota bacterium]
MKTLAWQPWSAEAFQKAAEQGKLVLLDISAVWCHWCHVMDETTYSDPEVIKAIEAGFVPIRVDTDASPEINERYNLGGWPTTAILSPEGRLLTGGTYIPPQSMLPFLRQVRNWWETEGSSLPPTPARRPMRQATSFAVKELPEQALQTVLDAYDVQFGGFGKEAKFPFPMALSLLFDTALLYQSTEARDALLQTLAAYARGGMYDPVEGGFFRYSTDAAFRLPHYEKMAEDNGQLLSIYSHAALMEPQLAEIADDVLRYVHAAFWQEAEAGFSASQDADQSYYALDASQRSRRVPPMIDRRLFTRPNAFLVSGILAHSAYRGDLAWQQRVEETLRRWTQRSFETPAGLAHQRNAPSQRGLLSDTVPLALACLDAYVVGGNRTFLNDATRLGDWMIAQLWEESEGAFRDQPLQREAIGALAEPVWPYEENGRAAQLLARLHLAVPQQGYAYYTDRLLEWGAMQVEEMGLFSAAFGIAAIERNEVWNEIDWVGDPPVSLGRLALWPLTWIRRLNAEEAAVRGYAQPGGYLCRADSCVGPLDVDALEQALQLS